MKKEHLLIEYLISSPDTFTLCNTIIDPDYFAPEYRRSIKFIQQYYTEYNNLPSPEQILVETKQEYKKHEITRDKIEYCTTEVEKFCKQAAIVNAIKQSLEYIEKEDYGTVESNIRKAVSLSLPKDVGTDYFTDPLSRLERLALQSPRISTGWKDVDDALGGGLAITEMIMFSANSGGGKSVTMSNLGLNMLLQGYDVCYISLELPEDMISQRYDMMITEIPSVPFSGWRERIHEIAETINTLQNFVNPITGKKCGKLTIKRLPVGTNANGIRSYLKEYEMLNKKYPTLLLVDYLDLMNPIEKISQSDVFVKDKLASEQLREIGFDYKCIIGTASQQNRGSIDKDTADLNQGDIAGGISKVNTVDVYVSITMTPQMKAAGCLMFTFLKTRSSSGVGTTVQMKWKGSALRIMDADEKDISDFTQFIDKKTNKNKHSKATTLNSLLQEIKRN